MAVVVCAWYLEDMFCRVNLSVHFFAAIFLNVGRQREMVEGMIEGWKERKEGERQQITLSSDLLTGFF